MLTTKYVRDHIDEIKESLGRRKSDYPIDKLLELDTSWRQNKTQLQELQAKRNKASIEISELKKKNSEIEANIQALASLKDNITELEKSITKQEQEIDKLLWNIPNVLDKSVPTGVPPDGNVILKTWGKINPKTIPTHEEILGKLNLLDMERAGKIAGSRFYYMKGDLVLLELSLLRFTLDFLEKRGYTAVLPPFMLKEKYYRGTTPLATFEDALYKVGESREAETSKEIEHVEEELYLIGTSEHAVAAMHADELFSGAELPKKYAGLSPCFRREAGAHGKDQKGIFRVHQFDKVEQFVYCRQEDEQKYFDEILKNSEDIWQALKIPYQLVLLCSGDTGHQMSKTVDLECYMPGQKTYRELGSCSSASTWQSSRLDIKYDEKGERKYVYTLNNTGISAQRALVCIVENYANADGTITVPDVLVPYMGKSKIG
jgi:seryl-tRNA synthetase